MKAPNMMWGENQYVIAGEYMEGKDYYIGYFNAYNAYGFTDQVPRTMYVLNTSFSGIKTINNQQFKFIKVSMDKIYGFRDMEIKGKKIRISDKERTLVDLMFNPDAVGGIRPAADILRNNLDKIETKKFIKYAAMFPDRGTIKRIGYVLSDAGIGKSRLAVLKNRAKGGSLIKFSKNGTRKGAINTEWGLIINDSN
jgi:predicted transcriptional regulator of viral defense system